MPLFNVLSLIEFDESKRDTSLIVIFDERDEKYYVYGTRRRPNEIKRFIDFKLAFAYESLEIMLHWISDLCNHFDKQTLFTYEMHQIQLSEAEYSDNKLNYSYLTNKLTRFTELFAYDRKNLTEGSLMEKLDMLTASTNL